MSDLRSQNFYLKEAAYLNYSAIFYSLHENDSLLVIGLSIEAIAPKSIKFHHAHHTHTAHK